jgi:regulator of sirC expression with transglutaminase-like and TPR domain
MSLPVENSELQALISLLDDPDPVAFQSVSERIFGMGTLAVHTLEDVWEHTFDEMVQNRIEQIVHNIQFEDIRHRLSDWVAGEEHDLLDGYCIITKFQYPELNEKNMRERFEKIRRDIWLELNNRLTALETIKVFNHILYEVHSFGQKPEPGKTFEPAGYFLNNLFENRRGNPMSLGILYVALARKLDLPIYGVGLPGHFIATYADDSELPVKSDNILFYINPFSKGAVFSRREVELYLKQAGITPDERYYTICSNKSIIARLIDELEVAFEKKGETAKAAELKALGKIVK